MSDDALAFHGAPDAHAYMVHERRLQVLGESVFVATPDAVHAEFMELRAQVDADVRAIKARLLGPLPAAGEDRKAAAKWISTQHRRLARVARRMATGFARNAGRHAHVLHLVAMGLHYMGESVKGQVKDSQHHGGLHALMRLALASGRQREALRLEVDGRALDCSPVALYFRALLLARLAGGDLTFAQIEVLDAWLLSLMPQLVDADALSSAGGWRADLDSNSGLRRGAREDAGPCLYLPIEPLEAARLAILKEYHAGRTLPRSGVLARLPIEDHIAVIDLVRRGLRRVTRQPVARARRERIDRAVDLHVGLAEVMAKGFAPAPYPKAGRTVRLVDVSESGFAFEADEAAGAAVAVDDLVALRLAPGAPMTLGKVVRKLAAADSSRVTVGVRRLSSLAQPTDARRALAGSGPAVVSLVYVPGADKSGRNDAYLMSDAGMADRVVFETDAGASVFAFRLNRVRERGRGWVMAGFEVIASRRLPEVEGRCSP